MNNLTAGGLFLGVTLIVYVAACYAMLSAEMKYGFRLRNRIALLLLPAVMEAISVICLTIGVIRAFEGRLFEPLGHISPFLCLIIFAACVIAAFVALGDMMRYGGIPAWPFPSNGRYEDEDKPTPVFPKTDPQKNEDSLDKVDAIVNWRERHFQYADKLDLLYWLHENFFKVFATWKEPALDVSDLHRHLGMVLGTKPDEMTEAMLDEVLDHASMTIKEAF